MTEFKCSREERGLCGDNSLHKNNLPCCYYCEHIKECSKGKCDIYVIEKRCDKCGKIVSSFNPKTNKSKIYIPYNTLGGSAYSKLKRRAHICLVCYKKYSEFTKEWMKEHRNAFRSDAGWREMFEAWLGYSFEDKVKYEGKEKVIFT